MGDGINGPAEDINRAAASVARADVRHWRKRRWWYHEARPSASELDSGDRRRSQQSFRACNEHEPERSEPEQAGDGRVV